MARAKGGSTTKGEDAGVPVKTLKNGDGKKSAKTGKPKLITSSAMRSRFASSAGVAGGGLGGGFNSFQGVGSNFYSPELSTDFLELPQSLHEFWNYVRFFARSEPFVGQAMDLHTELPLSKVRIGVPKAKNREMAEAATRFCVKWARRIGLLQRLISIVYERNLIGEAFIWCEDDNPDMPDDIRYEIRRILTEEGEAVEQKVEREDANERASKWLKKHYKGWTAIRCLPPEQIKVETFNFTDKRLFELIPDSPTKSIVDRARNGDPAARKIVESMPAEVVQAVFEGQNIPLNTDPYAGSFIHYIANKKSDYEPRGRSLLERCMRILVYREKLRQAQTSIASRHMTPIRIVWGENLNEDDLDALRLQVDAALQDPDYSIIANFQVTWEEMGADQRLLDLTGEYDLTDRQLYAGLGVTEALLSGESSYSGDRINLEVINVRYMLLREQIQEMVEEHFFKPMCYRMGFIEEDEDGEEIVLVPSLTFTRLALRDNRDTFDAMYNLYTKGSLDIETILELFNLDPITVREKLEKHLFTVNDPNFNEALRTIYGDAGRKLAEDTDASEKIAKTLGLTLKPKQEADPRFGGG